MEVRKRQLTNLFRHSEQCLGFGSGRRSLVSRPKQHARFPQCLSVVPLVNIAFTSARLFWKFLLKRKFPLQDLINCDLDVRTF
jgi:hypothetical protein